jgi:outer membrane cobalamin receptor
MTQLRLFLPACFLLSAFSTGAVADVSAAGIDEVIVTATRRPATIGEISSPISVISRAEVLGAKLTTDLFSF